jgi:putative tricarboxylic transport membrane protein
MVEDVKSSHDGPRAGEMPRASHIGGGLTITVLAIVLALATFAVCEPKIMFTVASIGVSSTVVPRVLAILVAATGIAVAAGFVPIRGPQEFYGGLVLVLLAVLALTASADLPGQRSFAFGPGTAPRLFALILAALGIAVATVGVVSDGPQIEKYKIYGPTLVIIGIFLFAAMIRPFGLVVATYLAFIVSIMGSTEMRWIESLIAAAVMTLFCVLLFVNLLNLPFQLWPQPNAHVILLKQFEEVFRQTLLIVQKLTIKAC